MFIQMYLHPARQRQTDQDLKAAIPPQTRAKPLFGWQRQNGPSEDTPGDPATSLSLAQELDPLAEKPQTVTNLWAQ